ncbi:MAG: maleylpyruvate isomerase family mycothiol-dependent enzyme [Acidimicrobiales bacterium]|nr:maleylpyruvate isomerase family mycothiol-dependent enzyme [Acidimicrobiales bacterium]
MDKVVEAMAAQQDELTSLVAPLDEDGWSTPSRCEGWTVADVVLHLAQTNAMAVASVQGRFDEVVAELTAGTAPAASVDEGAARMVERERGLPSGELLERWRRSAAELVDELGRCDPHRRLVWVAGDLSARTLATTRLAEVWIHTGDVAVPLGHEVVADDRLWHIARLAWRMLPYAFARAGRGLSGPVAFELEAPNGDTWVFAPEEQAVTVVRGPALDLCTVAGQRADAADTELRGDGPDAEAVLGLVRTFA